MPVVDFGEAPPCDARGILCDFAGGGTEVFERNSLEPVPSSRLSASPTDAAPPAGSGLAVVHVSGGALVVAAPPVATPVYWGSWCGRHCYFHTATDGRTDPVTWLATESTGVHVIDPVEGTQYLLAGGVESDSERLAVGAPAAGRYTSVVGSMGVTAAGDTVMSSSTVGVFVVDAAGMVTHFNADSEEVVPLPESAPFDTLPVSLGYVAVHGDQVFLVDTPRNVIWSVDTDTWTATRYAGVYEQVAWDPAPRGVEGYSGDGGPALLARFAEPHAIAVDAEGWLYVNDAANACIRVIRPDGIVETFLGKCGEPLPQYGEEYVVGEYVVGVGLPVLDVRMIPAALDMVVVGDSLYLEVGGRTWRVWLPER